MKPCYYVIFIFRILSSTTMKPCFYVIFIFRILWSTTVEPYYYVMEKTFFTHWFFNFFLYLLMVLHVMWSYSIFMVVVRTVRKGQVGLWVVCLEMMEFCFALNW